MSVKCDRLMSVSLSICSHFISMTRFGIFTWYFGRHDKLAGAISIFD